jgi:hypothetical protein
MLDVELEEAVGTLPASTIAKLKEANRGNELAVEQGVKDKASFQVRTTVLQTGLYILL